MFIKQPISTVHTALTIFSLAVAAALLISFVWVVNDVTQLGMQRQAQQRATGVWMGSHEPAAPVEASSPVDSSREPKVMASL